MLYAIRQSLILFIGFLGYAFQLQGTTPTWSVDVSQFQYSMNFNAQVVFNGASEPVGNHLVGVFVGNQCRGLGTPMMLNGKRYYFITVYANQSSGDTLTFKFYNAVTDQIYNSATKQVFQRNAIIGEVANPLKLLFANGDDFPIVFKSIPQQTTISGTGFAPLNLKNYLNQLDQDQISWQVLPSQRLTGMVDTNGVLEVSPILSYWTGTDIIKVIATENGPYAHKDTAKIYFQILPFTQLTFKPLPNQEIGPGSFFKNYNLDQYLIRQGNCRKYSLCQIPLKGNDPAPNWTVAGGGAGSMTINAKVYYGGKEQSDPNSQLAVFINGELRGVASPIQAGGSSWCFLTVNNGAAGPITFKYYDSVNKYLYTCSSNLNFVANTIAGSIAAPQAINLEPLDIQINANGNITANILNTNWLGTQYVKIIATDCDFPTIKRDSILISYYINPSNTGAPIFFSADSISFTQGACFPLYDANAFDQKYEEGQGLNYKIIGGADANAFTIDPQTGKLNWKQQPVFNNPYDSDSNNLYELRIEARNTDQKADTLTLKIKVLDSASGVFSASIQSSGFMCAPNQKTILSATAGQNYLWSTGSPFSEIAVEKPDRYFVTITNDLGCKATAEIQVGVIARGDIKVTLDSNCQFALDINMVSADNCALVRVMDTNPSNGNIIDCAGVWTYGIFDAYGNFLSGGKVTAEDKTPPRIICTNWLKTPVICNDVKEVLNNYLSIGNAYGSAAETILSPTPSYSDPSRHTINNAEGIAGIGSQNCALAPPNLLNSGIDKFKNVGYTYFSDNCQNGGCTCRTSLSWSDRVVYYGCDSISSTGTFARIFRTWVGTDCNGYSKDTIQEIRFVRPRAAFGTVATQVQTDGQNTDFQFNGSNTMLVTSCQNGAPTTQTVAGYDRVVEYDACSKDYSKIKWQDVTPFVISSFTGKRWYLAASNDKNQVPADSSLQCKYSINVKDIELPICNGGVKIDRTISVMDDCSGRLVKTWKVLIKIGDLKAPVVNKIPNIVLSTNATDCQATFNPSVAGIKAAFGVTISDNCSASPQVSVKVKSKYHYVQGFLRDTTWREEVYPIINNRISGLPLGPHRLILEVTDNCNNCVRDSFDFVVKDLIAPTMKCDDKINVTFSSDFALVSFRDLDKGSKDNCQLLWIQLRRSIASDCIVNFINNEYDTNGDGKITPRPKPYNESPGAKVDPTKVDGFDFNGDGDIDDFGETFEIISGVLYSPLRDFVALFCCDVTQSPTLELWGEDMSGNRNFCWTKINVANKLAPTCQAPLDVTIDCEQQCLGWLADAKYETQADACFGGTATLTSSGDCGNVQKNYNVTAVKGKCGVEKYIRQWTFSKIAGKDTLVAICKQTIYLKNIHHYTIRFPKDVSVNCNQILSTDSVWVDEVGCDILAVNISDKRFSASYDECYKIFRTYTVINWCTYNERCGDPAQNVHIVSRNIFDNLGKNDIYVLVIDEKRDGEESFWYSRDSILDKTKDLPFIPSVPGGGSNKCEGEYYHAFQYTQIIKVYDNEPPVISGTSQVVCIREGADCLGDAELTVKVEDNCTNGKIGLETNRLSVELFQDPTSSIPYQANSWTITPDKFSVGLKLTEGIAPLEFKIRVNNLPQGKHNILVVARDECGNLSTATRIPFEVKDCKAPAPICINGLSTELLPNEQNTSQATVWAKDLVASKVYDCNGQGAETQNGLKLITHYSINRVGEKALPDQDKLVFSCDDARLGVVPIEIHAWDTKGNHDFCVTFVEVQDNRQLCSKDASQGQIGGVITTDELEPLPNVTITLSGAMALSRKSNINGGFNFIGLKTGEDYSLTAQLDEYPLNGISTLDLILIMRHILGNKPIENPYRLIAADVNNSKSITTLDVILIRKLILGLDYRFRQMPSWRFLDANYVFPAGANSWSESFPEVVNINNLLGKRQGNFIAIKMGDVNSSASINGFQAAEVRTQGEFFIEMQEKQLQQGEEYRIPIFARQLKNVLGCQFALRLNEKELELKDVEYGLASKENLGVFENEGLVTFSWNGKYAPGALFTLVLGAKKDALLSQVLNLDRMVHPEAYDLNTEILDLKINFEGTQINSNYELKQNIPNPFNDQTQIDFFLPQATECHFTIRDVKGAIVYRLKADYNKGWNQVKIKLSNLNTPGVLYYTLETPDFTATKKMVVMH